MLGLIYNFLLGSPRRRPIGFFQVFMRPTEVCSSLPLITGFGCPRSKPTPSAHEETHNSPSATKGQRHRPPPIVTKSSLAECDKLSAPGLHGNYVPNMVPCKYLIEVDMEINRRLRIIERTIKHNYILSFSLSLETFERTHSALSPKLPTL
jgi:hypothetical protein